MRNDELYSLLSSGNGTEISKTLASIDTADFFRSYDLSVGVLRSSFVLAHNHRALLVKVISSMFSQCSIAVGELLLDKISPPENAAPDAISPELMKLACLDALAASDAAEMLPALSYCAKNGTDFVRYQSLMILAYQGIGLHEQMVYILKDYKNRTDAEKFIFIHRCSYISKSVSPENHSAAQALLRKTSAICTSYEIPVACFFLKNILENRISPEKTDSYFPGYTSVTREAAHLVKCGGKVSFDEYASCSAESYIMFLCYLLSLILDRQNARERKRAISIYKAFCKNYPFAKKGSLKKICREIRKACGLHYYL